MFLRFFFALFLLFPLHGQSLTELEQSFSPSANETFSPELKALNLKIKELKNQLRTINLKAQNLQKKSEENAIPYKELLEKATELRAHLHLLEKSFQETAKTSRYSEAYAFMHEKEITLEALITEYGSLDSLYIIPPEMAKLEIYLSSSLMIPQASWGEIIEIVCLQNGIGIKTINPFVKTLYWTLGNHTAALRHIISAREDFSFIEPSEQVCYILPVEGSEIYEMQTFLKRFINERMTSLHPIGNQLFLIGQSSEVQELAKLVEFVKLHHKQKTYRLISLDKISSEEIQKILETCFPPQLHQTQSIVALPVKKHLLLLGSESDLQKATHLIEEISQQICSPDQMTLYGYSCRYSDPADLATLLQQIYQVISSADPLTANTNSETKPFAEPAPCNLREGTIPPTCVIPNLVVNPKAAPSPSEISQQNLLPNFIVDSKTGLIIMVVKQCYLNQLKELVKKLDVPKKMVEIEVLLFEKKIVDQTQFGLNLLKLGDNVTSNEAKFKWSVSTNDRTSPGILDYFFSRKRPGGAFPPFNFAYNFLISQEDICIHSNPIITTVNQTQAVIDLVEEQSLNMGTVEDPRTSVITNTFVRAQYGIIIQITPTINFGNEENDYTHYVTLETDITFDTTTSDKNNRPDVSRRHIQNQVRIKNNETLILGGLRRSNSETNVDKIPFIGDIPGLGRLFSFTTLDDKNTEMFILITPRIVEDQTQQASRAHQEELKKRPGDSPELFKKILEAKAFEKEKKFKSTFDKIFKHERNRDAIP